MVIRAIRNFERDEGLTIDMAKSYEEAQLLWKRFNQVVDMAAEADFAAARAALDLAAAPRPELDPEDQSHRHFEQFVICAVMLNRALVAGEIGEMGDWIQWSLTEEPTDDFVHEMVVGRIPTFLSDPAIFAWWAFHTIIVSYLTALYEYARRRTAMPDICLSLLPIAVDTFDAAMAQKCRDISSADIQLGASVLNWTATATPELAPRLALRFEVFATEVRLMEWQRYKFALTLSTEAGRFSSLGSLYWADYALSRLGRHASDMDKAQLMSTLMRVDADGPADAECVIAQMKATRLQRSRGKTPLAIAREAALTVSYVYPFFVRTLAMKRADLILRGLQTWYQQGSDEDGPDADRLLISLPFGETATSYLCGGNSLVLTRDTQAALVKVSRAMNSFLQTYATVAGEDNSDLPIPERPGLPLESQEGLVEALLDAYCPAGTAVPGDPIAQVILPTEGHPIQAAQLSAWGRTWPIVSSLARPRMDRPAKSALLWGGSDAYSAVMELDMVEYALARVGVQVTRPEPQAYTSDLFLQLYQRSEYDIVWVASHGQFDHWKPHEVQLELGRDVPPLGLHDLWGRSPEDGERRLLVLNVCDGARFADPGLLPRVGLAPGLATAFQATISHLWPVRPWPSAAFGALLAHFLSRGESYFAAYVSALQALQKPAATVAADLEQIYGRSFELIERLQTLQDDFSRFETWGSAAFFQ